VNWAPIDTFTVLTGALCAMACAVLGNFLVLRRISMMGDAISHALLPGIVVAFLFSHGSRATLPMFVGAAAAGVLTAWAAEWLRGRAKVDEGASLGIVFTTLFAIGLILLRKFAGDIDLHPDHVLSGEIVYAVIRPPVHLFGLAVPRVMLILAIVLIVNLAVVTLLYKELKISSFDPQLATTLGINARLMHYLLMSLTAVTTVAAFEAVGPILVIAMLIVPAATAYLLTDRLPLMIALSLLAGALAATLGHVSAVTVPHWLGFGHPASSSGMMATMTGLLFAFALLASPRHGVLGRAVRRFTLTNRILCEDVLAVLYRREEKGETPPTTAELARDCLTSPRRLRLALWSLRRTDRLRRGDEVRLTDRGRNFGRRLIRSHRLWENYLQASTNLPADHVHATAERLEHLTDEELRARLAQLSGETDPHGKPIPKE
jgi:manganese/zinc/iron transport system permease protein